MTAASLPTILIIAAPYRLAANAVFSALGRGPNNLSRKLCAKDPLATFETPETHWMFQDMSATAADVLLWTAMKAGILPEGVEWGIGDTISEQDAIAACAHFQIYAAAQDHRTPTQWRNDELDILGLQAVPEEPFDL